LGFGVAERLLSFRGWGFTAHAPASARHPYHPIGTEAVACRRDGVCVRERDREKGGERKEDRESVNECAREGERGVGLDTLRPVELHTHPLSGHPARPDFGGLGLGLSSVQGLLGSTAPSVALPKRATSSSSSLMFSSLHSHVTFRMVW
jgi:hypothetical protein